MKLKLIPLILPALMLLLLISCGGASQVTDAPSQKIQAEPVTQAEESSTPTLMTFKASSADNVSVRQLPITSASGRIPSYDRDDWVAGLTLIVTARIVGMRCS